MANGMPINSPLNEEHLRRINKSLADLDDAQIQVELAKRAQIDVADQEKQIREAREKLLRIRQVYFPNQ